GGGGGLMMNWLPPSCSCLLFLFLFSPVVPTTPRGPTPPGDLPTLPATRRIVSSLSAADLAIRVAPAHEISISSMLRPTSAQCSFRIVIFWRDTWGGPNVFQISAGLATARRVSFSPAPPIILGGRGFLSSLGSPSPS